jgi:hypothetical protein
LSFAVALGLSLLAAAPPAPAHAPAYGVPAVAQPYPGGTKLGTRAGRKIEPVEDEPVPAPPWDLTRAGAAELPHRERRVGVRLGYEALVGHHYLLVAPEADLAFSPSFAAGLALPLRLEFLSAGEGAGLHRIRSADWDGGEDLGRLVPWFRWTGEAVTVEGSRYDVITVGRGALVRRYDPNLLLDAPALPTRATARTGVFALEAYLDDLFGPEVAAARVELAPAPGSFSPWLRTLRLGATYATDFEAPRLHDRFDSGVPRTEADGSFVLRDSGQVWAAGIDAGAVIHDTGTFAVEPWVDVSFLGEAGNGETLGLRLWFRPEGRASPTGGQLTVELRHATADYLHGYFDNFYRLSRTQLVRPRDTYLSEPKYTAVSARTGGDQFGLALEGEWSFSGIARVAAGYEDAPGVGARAIFLHGEARLLPWLDALAAIHRRGLTRGEPVFQLGRTDNTRTVALARVKPLPFLWLDAGAVRDFALDRSVGAYRSADVALVGELEIGWEL